MKPAGWLERLLWRHYGDKTWRKGQKRYLSPPSPKEMEEVEDKKEQQPAEKSADKYFPGKWVAVRGSCFLKEASSSGLYCPRCTVSVCIISSSCVHAFSKIPFYTLLPRWSHSPLFLYYYFQQRLFMLKYIYIYIYKILQCISKIFPDESWLTMARCSQPGFHFGSWV